MAQVTPQEQHIALCEWMGGYHKPTEQEKKSGCYYQYEPSLTLDWLHECEKKLQKKADKYIDYCVLLNETCHGYHAAISATKEQRLEALCRTLFSERFK